MYVQHKKVMKHHTNEHERLNQLKSPSAFMFSFRVALKKCGNCGYEIPNDLSTSNQIKVGSQSVLEFKSANGGYVMPSRDHYI